MMRSMVWQCGAWAAACLCLAATAGASASSPGGGSFFWHFQDTGFPGGSSVVAMRQGAVWPVIFNSNGNAYSLFATEGPNLDSNWHQIGMDLYELGRLRAATGVDGRIAVVAVQGPGVGEGVVSQLPGGFASLPENTVAIAFNNAGALITSDGASVSGLPGLSPVGTIVDLAVSATGSVGVITSSAVFHEYNPLLGAWHSADLIDSGFQGVSMTSASLSYDAQGRPFVVGRTGGDNLLAAGFSTQSGQWTTATIGASLSGSLDSAVFELASNSAGVVGTAFVRDGDLYYAYNDNNAGWQTTLVVADVDFTSMVGIAYDFDDLPVISYSDEGHLYLAYDPILVPEPATVALLLSGTGLWLMRRRAA